MPAIDPHKLEWTPVSCPAEVIPVDLADEESIGVFAAKTGCFDHLVSTTAIPATDR
ncbi:hypothetical protein GA0115260_1063212 [Streptomyces sp. MnatMP-M27]|uniref:hypothetical protein n=1 Tax=Streptomyces sp. MnatMP-M27 TaxID=1839768 RepID=UPI00081D5C9B|nr:hypothetical protein [Streptomyces sp. MnatMP-M27]SCG01919.1 hypothetical protein GA0115260_1063212 [Streptomyces sp. MnatMP-M27]